MICFASTLLVFLSRVPVMNMIPHFKHLMLFLLKDWVPRRGAWPRAGTLENGAALGNSEGEASADLVAQYC